MNLIPNSETISTSNLTTGWTNQSTSNSNTLANRNWEREINVDLNNDNSQWSMNSNQNSNQSVVSNINSSSLNSQQQQTINQSSDLETNSSSLMNENKNLTTNKNWSQVVDNKTTATTNNSISSSTTNQSDSPTQSIELNNNELIKSSMKETAEKFTNAELYSDTWGNIPINQSTPWEFNQANYQPPPREVHSYNGLIDNSWKYSSSTTGTDIWEANIQKKSTNSSDQLSPNDNKNAQNWNSAGGSSNSVISNHFGGTWGEDDTTVQSSNSSSKMWNGPPSNGLNSAASINNNNWMNENDKQWNDDDKVLSMNSNMNKGTNESSFSTWKDEFHDEGTSLWNKRQNGGQANARWKEDNNNDLLSNKTKMNNMTNQCANGINLNAHMQNGFSSASPGVLRLPSENSINKLQHQQQQQSIQQTNLSSKLNNNWLDQTGGWNETNQINNKNLNNGQANGMFWNSNAANTDSNAQSNWNNKPKDNMIMQSYQFKVLADKGFKKENIETALRNSNMNIKDAIDELRADVLKENCNDLDKRKNSGFNHTSSLPPNLSISNRNTSQFNQMSQQQPNQMFLNNKYSNKMSNTANAMLQDKRLGNLVQQIQLAVQSGHLNAQILHQPLSVTTIQLINQLLQFIKTLQPLQQLANANMNKNVSPSAQSELNVQITVIKQRISTLQNQIRTQQALFMNQQQQQQQQNNQQSVPNNSDLNNINNLNNGLSINPLNNNLPLGNSDFTKNLTSPDSPNLVNDFRDLQQSNQQSRLSTWKNSGTNFNENNQQGFSRAPGSIKPANNNNWFNEETWVVNDTAATNDITSALNNLNVQNQPVASSYINDSVPEFEPGKPWKGSQIKSSDDDPHLTPGSVNRSILSLNNFNNWTSKNNAVTSSSVAGLPTNTWTYNNGTANNSSNWNGFNSNESSSPVENLWQSGAVLKGPPPGLSPNKDSKIKSMALYLLIKNLTPMIDSSTLRTLCLQHGTLQMFKLLNNGVAIVKYKNREDAIKAQSALNNCFLSNTTIVVDLISENEVLHYLAGHHFPPSNWNNSNNNNTPVSNGVYRNVQPVNNNNLWHNNASNQIPQAMTTQVTTTESQWSFNGGVNLWNNSIDATASNLLPIDLLNGESA